MPTQATTNPSDGMTQSLLEQIFELWLRPELQTRGLDKQPEEVIRALVIFTPGQKPKVLIDAEAGMVVRGKTTRPIEAGEPVTEADLEAVEGLVPRDIDPDAGWIGFILFKDVYTIAFDFRRNKAKAARRMERATEFLATARLALDNHLKAPAVENLYAAAELVVVAQMGTLDDDEPPKSHQERRRWFAGWTKVGNAPSDHGRALADLAGYRAAARYADGSLRVRDVHLARLADKVADMIAHAEKEITNTASS
jgi:hypothetical protein